MIHARKFALLAAAAVLAFPGVAGADDTLRASARCNRQWVAVTVDAPPDAVIVARRPGGEWIRHGVGFVPTPAGADAATDYGIVLELEHRSSRHATDYTVIATGAVTTPTCAPAVAPTTTVAAPEPVKAPPEYYSVPAPAGNAVGGAVAVV